MSKKKIYSLINDARGRLNGELYVTDSLIVELFYKVEELCVVFLKWIADRFAIIEPGQEERLILFDKIDIDKHECESILSGIKYCIGILNQVNSLSSLDKQYFSISTLTESMSSIPEIQQSLKSSVVSFRVIGSWICAMGLHKESKKDVDQKLKVCMFLASSLAVIDETIKESSTKGIIQNLVNSIRVDLSVHYACYLMDITNYTDAYKYLYKAKKLKWKDQDKIMDTCAKMLGEENIPLDDSNITQKSISDGKVLLKGKEPFKFVEFKAIQP
jgi:hypothetical protein